MRTLKLTANSEVASRRHLASRDGSQSVVYQTNGPSKNLYAAARTSTVAFLPKKKEGFEVSHPIVLLLPLFFGPQATPKLLNCSVSQYGECVSLGLPLLLQHAQHFSCITYLQLVCFWLLLLHVFFQAFYSGFSCFFGLQK